MLKNNKNKIIFVSHAFPPLSGGGVQRISKFAIYLQEMGYNVEVVCTSPGETDWVDDKRIKDIESISVTRIGSRNLSQDLFSKILRKIWPVDFQFPWAIRVTKHLISRKLGPNDVIISSGPPHSMHIVGYLLKRKLGVKWLADFRDHFTLGPEYKVFTLLKRVSNRWFENQIYKTADSIIFNTRLNKIDVEKNKSFTEFKRGAVIYNGYDDNDLKAKNNKIIWPGNKQFNYLYLGGLRGDQVDGIFYRAFKEFILAHPEERSKISIQIVGNLVKKGSLVGELGLEDTIFFIPAVAYNEVGDYLNQSNGCLTWQRNREAYKGTIAGKVFDYIGAKKPLFSIGIKNGEIDNIITKNHIGISTFPENTKKIAEDFASFHFGVKEGIFKYEQETISQFEIFNRKQQAIQLSNLIQSLRNV